MLCWIQVILEEAKMLQALGKVTMGSGFTYMDKLTGNTMIEYHVDDTRKEFITKINKESALVGMSAYDLVSLCLDKTNAL